MTQECVLEFAYQDVLKMALRYYHQIIGTCLMILMLFFMAKFVPDSNTGQFLDDSESVEIYGYEKLTI